MQVTRLEGEFSQLIAALKDVGPVMALTRNEAAVHERDGTYLESSVNGHVGLVLGPDIDLRIFYTQWVHAFWVEEASDKGVNRSAQFFDAHGDAVHKIFERSMTDKDAFEGACKLFAASEQVPGISVLPRPAKAVPNPDSEIDVSGFRDAWTRMTDTHQFFGLLRKFSVARTQAMRLAGPEFAVRVGNDATRFVLQQASDRFLEIMIFVMNPGCIQIHIGPVSNIQVMGSWVNVLDPDFNLHLREDLIVESWIVRKPTEDGVVTSLELYDAQGETIAYLFGKRKPGIPEIQGWRELVAEIPAGGAQ
jgi:putative hemin transport protein